MGAYPLPGTIFLVKLAMGGLFRVIAVFAPSEEAAQALSSVVLMTQAFLEFLHCD